MAEDRALRRSRRESVDAIVWRFRSGLFALRCNCAAYFRRLDGLVVLKYHGRRYVLRWCNKATPRSLPIYVREELVPLRGLDVNIQIFSWLIATQRKQKESRGQIGLPLCYPGCVPLQVLEPNAKPARYCQIGSAGVLRRQGTNALGRPTSVLFIQLKAKILVTYEVCDSSSIVSHPLSLRQHIYSDPGEPALRPGLPSSLSSSSNGVFPQLSVITHPPQTPTLCMSWWN